MRLQEAMAEYFLGLATWRRWRASEMDRDQRHLVSAGGLERLAAFVRELADDDPRLDEFRRLTVGDGAFQPGQQVHFAAARFHFYQQESDLDAFISHLEHLAKVDRNEHGRFAGTLLPAEDDPWA